jgi:hypothetical protein
MEAEMSTYREVYMNRIEAGLPPEEIRRRFELMVANSDGDRVLAGQNLGYILGYYGKDIREEWYGCLSSEDTPVVHPIFGPRFGRGKDPTPEEALQAGKD